MCFSAGASFGASAVLSVIGVSVIKQVKAPKQLLFAAIPIVFAVQQCSEGLVWLSLSHPEFAFLEKISSYMFLIFAQMVWPLCVPTSIYLLEKNGVYKKILLIFVAIGVMVAAYFAFRLFNYGVNPNILGRHVSYKQIYPDHWNHIADMCYGIATILPIFISRVKKIWIFGLAISVSYLVAALVYVNYILSVWCFFASIISVIIYFIVKELVVQKEYMSRTD